MKVALINTIAALTLVIAPYATAAEKDKSPNLEPLVTVEMAKENSFFSPKSAKEIKQIMLIEEELEESLVWDIQASN